MSRGLLVGCFVAYTGASLLHFAHNATSLAAYPNLPASITVPRIYGVWAALALLGAFGALLLRRGYLRSGLWLIAIYGAFGLDGFAHYLRAPMSHHAPIMNATIWLEAITGTLLMLVALRVGWISRRVPAAVV
jgi:hypothetical protein